MKVGGDLNSKVSADLQFKVIVSDVIKDKIQTVGRADVR